MTDEQIVRTLAEFMGFPDGQISRESSQNNTETRCWWVVRTAKTVHVVPDYLTSYDALAPVFKKFHNEVDSALAIRRSDANYWFDDEPRDLAEELAKAIEEAGAR